MRQPTTRQPSVASPNPHAVAAAQPAAPQPPAPHPPRRADSKYLMLTRSRDRSREVVFNPPRAARYVSLDRAASGECLIREVNDDGARLELVAPDALPSDFFLLFTNQPRPVFRQCRVQWTEANQVGVIYIWSKPDKAAAAEPQGLAHDLAEAGRPAAAGGA